ncbi:MAG: polysaccharide deacetylase family protein [Alphaproteobacteria bacterium]|nr:polysaccharide deacetylase family protein [Alphaproteobacteria bacterium]
MSKAYLTIDDSPSPVTINLINELKHRDIQALLFCRGDYIEQHFNAVIYAIKHGHIIGNHSYSHRKSSELSFDEWTQDLKQTEQLIEKAYKQAGGKRSGLYYRFPYLDRGDGQTLERIWPKIIKHISTSENYILAENSKVHKMQAYLKAKGFTQPFYKLNHPVYNNISAISKVADTLLTDTTQDWRMLKRHLEKKEITLNTLKTMLNEDPFIKQNLYEHVFLIHDDPEIYDISLSIIDYIRETLNFKFLDFDKKTA